MDKYNPKQFEIIGKMTTTKIDEFNYGYPYINNVKCYARILIKHKKNLVKQYNPQKSNESDKRK